jgi:multiple sugar transport system permease protein/raffinose/stachyose/melibiose transport system permease protein
MKNNRFVAIVLIPALALLTLFIVVPIIASFVVSTFDYNPLRAHNIFLGLGNYRRLLTDQVFLRTLRNTLVFVFVTVGINIALTLLLAQCISGIRRRVFRNLALAAIFLPCIAPIANSAVVWSRSLFPTRGGLFNMALTAVGLSPINWIGNPLMLMPALILFTVWVDIGYNTVLFTAGMEGIPKDFYEAADSDGIGPVRRFFNITLPLLGRTFSFVSIMTVISHFQMFAQFEIMAKDGGAGKAGQVLTTSIYYAGFKAKDMGYASTISVALFFIILVITMVQRRLNRIDWEY